MKGRNGLLTLIILALISSTSVGCFGLVPIRESLELMRGEPLIVEIDQKTNISYTFQTAQSEEYENSSTFEITDSVTELIIYVRVSMPDPLDISKEIRDLIEENSGVNITAFSCTTRFVHIKIIPSHTPQ